MKCSQCDRPAFYLLTDENVPLCLICYSTWQHSQNVDFLKNAVMMNQALDDMDRVLGMQTSGGRIPVEYIAQAIQRSHTLNNIVLNNSQVGVLNTGAIQKIDAAITLSQGSDIEPIMSQIKSLVEAVISSNELKNVEKNEAIELAEAISEEIVKTRRPASIRALLTGLRDKVKASADLAVAAERLWEIVSNLIP